VVSSHFRASKILFCFLEFRIALEHSLYQIFLGNMTQFLLLPQLALELPLALFKSPLKISVEAHGQVFLLDPLPQQNFGSRKNHPEKEQLQKHRNGCVGVNYFL
jgi:hypothetical protein